jgi:ubiquinone/menaquinone biosynthesis C-methylase UbiE
MTFARLQLCSERINRKHKNYTLLDLGCRTMSLKPLLEKCTKYHGTDLTESEGVIQCDLEEILPFESDSYDIVTVLDVLEHIDNPHLALKESLRLAKKAVYISLPNMYYIEFRLRFLRGNGISGKYAFSPNPIPDRHKWILSYSEAITFIKSNVGDYNVNVIPIIPGYGKYKLLANPIHNYLAKKWPNMFIYGALFEIGINK